MSRARALAWLPWLAPVLLLAAVLGGVALVRAGREAWFGAVLVAFAVLPAAWMLISALFPARVERTCPACGRPALARASREALHGLACRACGFEDEGASAWLIAEEEEPSLEPLVLAQRAERERPVRAAVERREPRG